MLLLVLLVGLQLRVGGAVQLLLQVRAIHFLLAGVKRLHHLLLLVLADFDEGLREQHDRHADECDQQYYQLQRILPGVTLLSPHVACAIRLV